MYNVRVTEVGVPVSFKVFDAFLCKKKNGIQISFFVCCIKNLTVLFKIPFLQISAFDYTFIVSFKFFFPLKNRIS